MTTYTHIPSGATFYPRMTTRPARDEFKLRIEGLISAQQEHIEVYEFNEHGQPVRIIGWAVQTKYN